MKILEECDISFPPESPNVIPTTSPLTFFDHPWLLFPPLQPLFFFQLPTDIDSSCFNSDIIPRLKRSLSSALHCYFPIAGKLAGNPDEFTFFSDRKCSVRLTVAHSDADFEHLCSYSPRNADLFHQLVPSLTPISRPPTPLIAFQITYFAPSNNPNSSIPSSGISIGIAYHPVLCDQRCFSSFLHSWAAFCKYGHLNEGALPPTFDRSVILDSDGLSPVLLGHVLDIMRSKDILISPTFTKPANGLLRATFVMGATDIQNAKGWIIGLCDKGNRAYPVLLSPSIVVCAFVWASLLQCSVNEAKGPMYFGFIGGGITRPNYQVPINYLGNCVAFGRPMAKREELLGEGGILAAADAMAMAIQALDNNVLGGAQNWISEWEILVGSEEHIHVIGSPKVNLYEIDFGWGRPKKIEEISIDVMRGISMTQSSDLKGGIEIGLALSNSQMKSFCSIFNQGLRVFFFRCVDVICSL